MKKPEELPVISDKVLYNLKADDRLKKRIIYQASRNQNKSEKQFTWRVLIYPSIAVAVMVLVLAFIGSQTKVPSLSGPADISVFAAGGQSTSGDRDSSAFVLCEGREEDLTQIQSVQIKGKSRVDDPAKCRELIEILYRFARVSSDTELNDSSGILLFRFSGEKIVRISIHGNCLDVNGLWVCNEFFDAYQAMINQN